jgi:hypothetical protein
MVWRYTSSVSVDRSRVSSLWQVWRVWSDIPNMPLWDQDCHSARLESTLEEGKTLYIVMKNKPEVENECIITRVTRPNEVSPKLAAIHFDVALPLAKLSFEYEAELIDGTEGDEPVLKLSHTTVISGFLSGIYGYALSKIIKEGCDHMSSTVPTVAENKSSEPEQ